MPPLSINEELADAAASRAVTLARYNPQARREILGYLERLELRLDFQVRQLLTSPGSSQERRARLATLLVQVRATIAEEYEAMAVAQRRSSIDLATAESSWAAAQFSEVAGAAGLSVNLLTATQMRALADSTLIDGSPARSWWESQAGDLYARFEEQIREGFEAGESVDDLVRRVRGRATGRRNLYELNGRQYTYVEFRGGLMDLSTRHAEALVRTAVQTVSARARQDTFAQNADVVKGLVQMSTFDLRTTTTCLAYGGKAWLYPDFEPIDHDLPYLSGTPRHWNCVTGDALVSAGGRVSAASERRIEGEVIVLRTARGRELICTPNHPVLTGRGWVAAGALRVGDHVVCNLPGQRPRSIDREHEQMPSRLQDVARSFLGSRGVLTVPMPLSAEDFHGDARQGEVAVVGTDRLLGYGLQAALAQHRQKLAFGLRRAAVAARLEGRRRLALLSEGARSAAHRIVGGLDLLPPLLRAHPAPAGAFLGGLIAQLDSGLAEHSLNRSRADAETLRDTGDPYALAVETQDCAHRDVGSRGTAPRNAGALQDPGDRRLSDPELEREIRNGLAGPVELDEIVSLGSREFRGHVFNLETSQGFFVANEIVTHNCRSTEAPLLKSWQELGIPLTDSARGVRWSRLDGDVPVDLTMDEFLRRRSAAQIDEKFGPGIAKLWREKRITLEDMVSLQSGRPLSLREIEARSGIAA